MIRLGAAFHSIRGLTEKYTNRILRTRKGNHEGGLESTSRSVDKVIV